MNVNITVTSMYCPRQYLASSSAWLLFINDTYNTPQTLQLYAIDDNVARGSSYCQLLLTATSEDIYFNNANKTVTITLLDDDTAGLIVNKGTLVALQSSSSEVTQLMINEGNSGHFDVSLRNQPLFNVSLVFTMASSRITINPAIHFTPVTWNITQPVSVTAAHDGIVEGPQWDFVTISFDSDDSTYSHLSFGIGFLVIDIDTPSVFQVSPPLSNTTDRGGTAEVHVILVLSISGPIHITTLISKDNVATTTPSFLTFDPDQLGQFQTVVITGVKDDIITGNRSYEVLFAASGSGVSDSVSVKLTGIDTNYAALNCSKDYLIVNETGM